MRRWILTLAGTFALALGAVAPALAQCTPDSVEVGPLCVDKYEASAWDLPSGPQSLVIMMELGLGIATSNDLINAGAIQRGAMLHPFYPVDDYTCSKNGNDCGKLYAASVPGVHPSTSISWFQAQRACANTGKRLLTNAEWQMAVAGTYDPNDNDGFYNTRCHTGTGFPYTRLTGQAGSWPGSSNACISRWGVEDMIGNASEWVADWNQTNRPDVGYAATSEFGNDASFGVNDASSTDHFLAAWQRGGNVAQAPWGGYVGAFMLNADTSPSDAWYMTGFRCARPK